MEPLPDNLKESAYRTSNEAAWLRQDALSVIEFLHNLNYAILGVDIWIPTLPGPTIPRSIYDLDLSDLTKEKWSDFVERSYDIAIKFIKDFEFDDEDKAIYGSIELVFNILSLRARLHAGVILERTQ